MRSRIIFFSVLAAILAYVIYWFVLYVQIKGTIIDWIEARRLQGIVVSYDKLSISGFPYRFEVELVKPVISRAGGSAPFKWTSPLVVMESLAWKPNHVVVLTEQSNLVVDTTAYGQVSLDIKGGKASFVNKLGGELKRAAAVADSLTIKLASKPNDTSTVGHTEVHLRTEYDYPPRVEGDLNPAAPPLENLALSFADVHLGGIPQNPYGNDIALLQAQVELRGITAPARYIKQMSDWRDRDGSLELMQFALKWGGYDAKATGTLSLDKEMRPLGSFVVKVKGYEPLIDYLDDIHFIDAEMASNAKASLNMIVQSGSVRDEGRVAVPIAVQGGRFFFGPLPLAKVPSITPYLTLVDPDAPVVPPVAPAPVKK